MCPDSGDYKLAILINSSEIIINMFQADHIIKARKSPDFPGNMIELPELQRKSTSEIIDPQTTECTKNNLNS